MSGGAEKWRVALRVLVPVAVAISLAACTRGQTNHEPGGELLGDITVADPMHLEGDYKTIQLHLIDVTADSRCPVDTECPAQGSVSVRLRADTVRVSDGEPMSREVFMHVTPGRTPAHTMVNNVSVSLYSVNPERHVGHEIALEEYSIRTRIVDIGN